MSQEFGPIYDRRDYAGFIRRTAALVIDVAILIAIYAAVMMGWYVLVPVEWVTDAADLRIAAGWYVFSFGYMFGFRFLERGTPGYRIMRIRYAYLFSRKPTKAAIMLRSVSAVFLMWFFALDHFWILFDERKQSWHDKISSFYVIKRSAQPIGTRRIVQSVTNIFGLTFICMEPAAGGAATHSAAAD